MIEGPAFELGLAADVDAEVSVRALVGCGDDHAEVRVAALELVACLDDLFCFGVRVNGGAGSCGSDARS